MENENLSLKEVDLILNAIKGIFNKDCNYFDVSKTFIIIDGDIDVDEETFETFKKLLDIETVEEEPLPQDIECPF